MGDPVRSRILRHPWCADLVVAMMTPDQYRREGAEAMREAAARIAEDAYRCRSCGQVFLQSNGHSDCSQGDPDWDTPTDAQKAAAIRAIDPAEVLAKVEWKGPGETPHQYSPDYMAQGDCRICGHTWEAHQPALDAVARPRIGIIAHGPTSGATLALILARAVMKENQP